MPSEFASRVWRPTMNRSLALRKIPGLQLVQTNAGLPPADPTSGTGRPC